MHKLNFINKMAMKREQIQTVQLCQKEISKNALIRMQVWTYKWRRKNFKNSSLNSYQMYTFIKSFFYEISSFGYIKNYAIKFYIWYFFFYFDFFQCSIGNDHMRKHAEEINSARVNWIESEYKSIRACVTKWKGKK